MKTTSATVERRRRTRRTGSLRFSLRSLFVGVLTLLLVLGWWADHRFLANKIELLAEKDLLEESVEEVVAANSPDEYHSASRRAVLAISRMIDRGSQANIAIPIYVKAMKEPQRFPCDYSVAGEASIGLASLGSDAIPTILGLLSDDDARTRKVASACLARLVIPGSRLESRLSQDDKRAIARASENAIGNESDESVRHNLNVVLRYTSG